MVDKECRQLRIDWAIGFQFLARIDETTNSKQKHYNNLSEHSVKQSRKANTSKM